MNKYSDISTRYVIPSVSTSGAITPKPLKSYRDSISHKDIAFNRYHSDSPGLSGVESPINTYPGIGISQLSYEHNQKLLDFTENPSPRQNVSIRLPDLSSKYNDYTSVLDSIEKVLAPNTKQVHVLLKDSKSFQFTQPSNEFRFYKIKCKGKRSPLQVKIKMAEGKIIIFMSFSEPYPSHLVHDRVYKYTYFEITDRNYNFKSDCIYLGIRSYTYSVFKLKINFGKVVTLADLRRGRQLTVKDDRKEPETVSEIKERGRNFIRENIKVLNSPGSRSPELKNKSDEWEGKVCQMKMKKSNLIKLKKDKAIEKITRRERKFLENLKNQEQQTKEQTLKKIVTFWIEVLVFQKSACFIRGKIGSVRQQKLARIIRSAKARVIQRTFRRRVKFPDDKHALHLANRSLLCYLSFLKPLALKAAFNHLISSFTFYAHRNELANGIKLFFKKIVFIQKQIRAFLETKEKRILSLVQLWNRAIDKTLFSKRKTSIKRRESTKLMTIPKNTRNELLLEFYKSKWRELRDLVRRVLAALKPFRVVKFFAKGSVTFISFDYFPTEAQIMAMVQESIKS